MKPETKQVEVVRGMRKFAADLSTPCKSWRIVWAADDNSVPMGGRVVSWSIDMEQLRAKWLYECNAAKRNGYTENDLYILLPGEYLSNSKPSQYRIVTVNEFGYFEPCVYLDGVEPLFDTAGEAQNFLDEHHGDMGDAVRNGEIPDYDFDADKIVAVPAGYTAAQQL